MFAGQRLPQRCFIVFRAERIEPDIPFAVRRLHADLRAALDETAGIFQQLHQRIEAVRPQAQRRINHHPQLIPAGESLLITLPLVIAYRPILWIGYDRQPMFLAEFIAEMRHILPGEFRIPVFAPAIQCCGADNNVIVDVVLVDVGRHDECILFAR